MIRSRRKCRCRITRKRKKRSRFRRKSSNRSGLFRQAQGRPAQREAPATPQFLFQPMPTKKFRFPRILPPWPAPNLIWPLQCSNLGRCRWGRLWREYSDMTDKKPKKNKKHRIIQPSGGFEAYVRGTRFYIRAKTVSNYWTSWINWKWWKGDSTISIHPGGP